MSNFNNNPQFMKIQQMLQKPQQFRTKGSTKFAVSVIFGVVPMLIAWIVFRSSSVAYYDPLFMQKTGTIVIGFLPVDIGYEYMWLIALGALIISIVGVLLVIKFDKDVKVDVFSPTISLVVLTANFYLFPYLGSWRFLTAIPMFMLGGLIANLFLLVFIIYKTQKSLKNMQGGMNNTFGGHNNPFENMQKGHNPFMRKPNDLKDVEVVKEKKEVTDKNSKPPDDNKTEEDKEKKE